LNILAYIACINVKCFNIDGQFFGGVGKWLDFPQPILSGGFNGYFSIETRILLGGGGFFGKVLINKFKQVGNRY
jgi:hypothetical protein